MADEDRVLLVRDRSNVYQLPGGEQSYGEPAGEALRRHVEEQTGYAVAAHELLWIRERKGGVDEWSAVEFFYRCTAEASGAAPHGGGPDQAGVEWVSRRRLAELSVLPRSLVAPLEGYLTDRGVASPVHAVESG